MAQGDKLVNKAGRLLFMLAAVSASAQIPTKGDVFIGYSYLRASMSTPAVLPDQGLVTVAKSNLNGWNVSLQGRVLPSIGLVADFSGQYGSQNFTVNCGLIAGCVPSQGEANTSIYNVLFGPRVSISVHKIIPFAHALFGVSHSSENVAIAGLCRCGNSFADAVGGGVDYRIVRVIGWRTKADFLQTRFSNHTQNDFRLSTGLVLRF